MESTAAAHDELDYVGGGLPKTTNWWGAFVIGLAGTILVTGIAPVMVTSLGAVAIPSIFLITASGYLLCLFLAELSAMMPDRSGGSPAYAYPAYKERWPRGSRSTSTASPAWAYWLGWFPVAPLNMILASFTSRTTQAQHDLGLHADPHVHRVVDGRHRRRRHPAAVHPRRTAALRFGTFFETALALLSMIPLTFLALGHAALKTGAPGCYRPMPRNTAKAVRPSSGLC